MPRRLLAMLLLNANHVVPLGAIVEELWGAMSTKRARQTVQTHVYQLRQSLEHADKQRSLIQTRAPGYLLRLDDDQLDLWEFERLADKGHRALRDGDAKAAAAHLRQALALWTGDPLGDLDMGSVLSGQAALLSDRRMAVLEQRIEADLRLGEHRMLIGELTGLCARFPLHEEFTAQLMIAAARSGRRVEGLEAYRALRGRLVEQLGIEPAHRLRQLHQELLADRPEPTRDPIEITVRAAAVPAQLPFDINDFVGRERELAQAAAAIDESSVRLPLVALNGQAGIGKSAFAVHLSHQLRHKFNDGQLVAQLHDPSGRPVDPFDVLGSFLHALGHEERQIPATTHDRSQQFRSAAADRRLLVLLDDAASVDQVLPLLPGGPGSAVLITSRVRARGLAVTTTIGLTALDDRSGLALLTSVLGTDRTTQDPDQARRIVELCDHSPLAIRIAAEKLLSRPVWTLRKFADRLAVESRRLAELSTGSLTVRDGLESARGRLSSFEKTSLMKLCGLGPTRFDIPTAAQLLDLPELSVEPLMEALVDAHLLSIVGTKPTGTAWFRFPDLIRLHAVSGGP
ncbi:AfsR/SARP family transcriptional regulator [Actinokineospora xionganensis]|uniref:Winged helix-turn-helix domain-containing protein n=1 Tax=Actinokineospora xionganensis TaxID=2684470 RepID=A0ABR7KZX1_9PSEU|nr:BTAD domain-containing putative transcriptional regulator [Actinokineospora xionganensis]MBC6445975.1 winged helix-turn-helix domain-containing protein [Actinokineospora xionganensis]